MNRKSTILFGALAFAAVLVFLHNLSPADETPKAAEEIKQFSNGILVIDIMTASGIESSRETQMITDAKLVKIGDRYFVRGKGYVAKDHQEDHNYKWFKGVDVAIAWNTVTAFYDMTPQQLEEYLADSDDKNAA